jgi:hypothetical protein
MRPEVRRRNNANKQRQTSKNYFKNNRAGDSGGQAARPQPTPEMDAGMIFQDHRSNQRITASKGGMIKAKGPGMKKGGLVGGGRQARQDRQK